MVKKRNRTNLNGFFVLMVLTFLFISMDAHAILPGRNLITNASFENPPGYDDDDPRGWWSWNSDFNGLTHEKYRKGGQSVYLSCPCEGEVQGVVFTYREVEPGKKYTFSCYAINSARDPIKGNVFGQISIEWRKRGIGKDEDGNDIEVDVEISRDWGPKFKPGLNAIKWTFFTMTATAPPEADNCNFVIQFFNNGGSGKFFVDDVSAEKK